MFLHIAVRIPKPAQYEPRGVVAVDVNKRYIYYGSSRQVDKIETVVERAERQRRLAERLQQKYSRPKYEAWRRRRGILNRIRHFHRRARNIVVDWARKTALKIVTSALAVQAVVAREDLTGLKERLDQLPYEHRKKAVWTSYRRLAWWIDWQAEKRGVPAVVVDPRGTSTTCPKCGGKIEEVGHRQMRCAACGFEEDRDVVAVLNIEKRALLKMGGPLAAPTAPPPPNDGCSPEPMGGTDEPPQGNLGRGGGQGGLGAVVSVELLGGKVRKLATLRRGTIKVPICSLRRSRPGRAGAGVRRLQAVLHCLSAPANLRRG